MNLLTNISNTPVNSAIQTNKTQVQSSAKNSAAEKTYKPDILDFFSEKVVNKNDINDMVTTPRAIFKGYLCFTAGTAVNTIASFIKNDKISNPLKILGCLTSIYGTYNFVKPFLIREENLTKTEK